MAIRSRESFVQQLLAQDEREDASAYADRRADLLRRLIRSYRRERSLKFGAAFSVLVTFSILGIAFFDQFIELRDNGPPGLFGDAGERLLAIVTIICGVATALSLILYFLTQRYALRMRDDARDVALLELQESVARLREQIATIGDSATGQ